MHSRRDRFAKTAWPSLEMMFDLVSCIGRCGL